MLREANFDPLRDSFSLVMEQVKHIMLRKLGYLSIEEIPNNEKGKFLADCRNLLFAHAAAQVSKLDEDMMEELDENYEVLLKFSENIAAAA